MIETPHDINAEMYVLGCCMVNNEYIGKVAEIINEEDFYQELHKDIFKFLKLAYSKGEDVNDVSVAMALKENYYLKSKGGFTYISSLIDCIQDRTRAWKKNTKLIKEQSQLRKILTLTLEIQNDLEQSKSSKNIIEKASQTIFDMTKESDKKKIESVKVTALKTMKCIEKMMIDKNAIPLVKTGFHNLDFLIGGFGKQNLIILAGKTSMGKTSFALNLAENVAKQHKIVVIFSLEMSKQELDIRFLSSLSNIDNKLISVGNLTPEQAEVIAKAFTIYTSLPIYIDDSSNINVIDIRAKLRVLANKLSKEGKTIDLVIVDYLQIMKTEKGLQNRNLEIADLSKQLKFLAKDFDIPVLCLSQLNRESDKRGNNEPILSDLRDSGSIEQDADKVLFVHRESYYKPEDEDLKRLATIIVRKNRGGGSTGKATLGFNATCTKFYNLDETLEG